MKPDRDNETSSQDPTLVGSKPLSVPDDYLLTGVVADRFRIISLLGRGGMGEVYEAEDLTLGRRVALKAINPDRRLSQKDRDRFQSEARLLSRLDHPGICRIHDLVEADERDFLVLELIEGRTLRLARDDMDEKTRLDLALQVAAVLEVAHIEGIVHRDLKPDNIMLTTDGQAKVLDFGLARDLDQEPVKETTVVGTPAYLSPEQALGEPATPASDMYSFGLVMQQLFTGELAYEDSGIVDDILTQARMGKTRPVTGIDRHLARLIERLEDRSPAARPTAVEARRKLAWIQRKPIRRIRRWSIAAAIVLVLAAGAKYMVDLDRERQIAEQSRAEAEDLVEFMLGDLRERLEPVGRLDVLDEVGDRALAYYTARSTDERTDADHHRFARAMNQIGEVRLNQGDLEAAREAFDAAHLAGTALVDQNPSQGEWLLTLGASEFWLGNVAYLEDDLAAAEQAFLNYRDVAEQLVALDPGNEEWQRELGYAHTNLAALHEARGEKTAALEDLDESIRIKRLLLDAAPDDPGRRSDLINSLAWHGSVSLTNGDLRPAHQRFELALKEAETLVAIDPGDMDHRELLSSLQNLSAATAEQLGLHDRSEVLYLASLQISRQLVDHDPSNTTWLQGLAVNHVAFGNHLVRGEEYAGAERQFTTVITLADGLTDSEMASIGFPLQLADAYRGLARVAMARGNLATAGGLANLALAKARLAIESTGGRDAQATLARFLVVRGEIQQLQGQPALASASWQEAHDILAPLIEGTNSNATWQTWMCVLALQGRLAEAREVAADLRAIGFAQRDFIRFSEEHDLLAVTDPTSE